MRKEDGNPLLDNPLLVRRTELVCGHSDISGSHRSFSSKRRVLQWLGAVTPVAAALELIGVKLVAVFGGSQKLLPVVW